MTVYVYSDMSALDIFSLWEKTQTHEMAHTGSGNKSLVPLFGGEPKGKWIGGYQVCHHEYMKRVESSCVFTRGFEECDRTDSLSVSRLQLQALRVYICCDFKCCLEGTFFIFSVF